MKKICDISDYLKVINDIINMYENDTIVYRGENKIYNTFCYPNIFRSNYIDLQPYFEKNVLDEMTADNLTTSDRYILKAIDAQHGGFPSRLLDVTYNALIALYFAVTPFYTKNEDADDNDDGVVYVFDFEEAYCATSNEISYVYDSIVNRKNDQLINCTLFRHNHKFIDHVKSNERIIAQQGAVILFQGDYFTPIPPYLYEKIIIDHASKKHLRNQLKNICGITTSYIYPEINNKVNMIVDKSLRYKHYTFSIKNEIELFKNNFRKFIDFQIHHLIKIYKQSHSQNIIDEVILIEKKLKEYKNDISQFIEIINSKDCSDLDINDLLSFYNNQIEKLGKKVYTINSDISLSYKELLFIKKEVFKHKGGSYNGEKEKDLQWEENNQRISVG